MWYWAKIDLRLGIGIEKRHEKTEKKLLGTHFDDGGNCNFSDAQKIKYVYKMLGINIIGNEPAVMDAVKKFLMMIRTRKSSSVDR